jgi:hypothetical protein
LTNPRILQRGLGHFCIALAVLTLISAAARYISAIHGAALSQETQRIDHFAFSLILAWGVLFDRLAGHVPSNPNDACKL